uniref:Uncharacterized protein n=1 Tax=Vespula pensylvanica TaxID=30213 RepID=A0A834KVN9_VESPE|nr:hypothetical protein H0235_013623 [Vespula pensylvanica]
MWNNIASGIALYVETFCGQLNVDFPAGQSAIPSNRNTIPSVYTMYILYTSRLSVLSEVDINGANASQDESPSLNYTFARFQSLTPDTAVSRSSTEYDESHW